MCFRILVTGNFSMLLLKQQGHIVNWGRLSFRIWIFCLKIMSYELMLSLFLLHTAFSRQVAYRCFTCCFQCFILSYSVAIVNYIAWDSQMILFLFIWVVSINFMFVTFATYQCQCYVCLVWIMNGWRCLVSAAVQLFTIVSWYTSALILLLH